MAIKRQRISTAYGLSDALLALSPEPVVAQRAPQTSDFAQIGTLWLDQASSNAYVLISIIANSSLWATIAGSGTFTNLTVNGILTVHGGYVQDGGTFVVTSDVNAPNAIFLETNTGVLETIQILNSQGTSVSSVLVKSNAGGVTLRSGLDTANSILIQANAGTTEQVHLLSSQGTSDDSILLESISGGITLSTLRGNISLVPHTNTAAATAIIVNAKVGVATFTGVVTASGATQDFTITNNQVSSGSGILVTVTNIGANDAKMSLEQVFTGAGSFVVKTINNGTQALNGNVVISWIVLN